MRNRRFTEATWHLTSQYATLACGTPLWFGSFQARSHLAADGQVGPLTWQRLIVQVKQGNTGSAVSAVQHNLRFAYGYAKVAVDGQFGPATNAVVRSFQAKFKIGADGIVGPITWNVLIGHEG
jgi:zinc D-Ala-D-Ala carboxypeptidase